MDDRNLSVEEILEQYSKKSDSNALTNSQESLHSDKSIDIDDIINGTSPKSGYVPTKTEMIEDVLEVGDNSFVFDPGDESDEPAAADAANPAEDLKPEPKRKFSFGSKHRSEDDSDKQSPIKDSPETAKPAADIGSVGGESLGLRKGRGTSSGTKAIERALDSERSSEAQAAPKENVKAVNPHSEPVLKPITGEGADDAIMQSLIKLKNERGAPKQTGPKVNPVNRASINDIDLEVSKKIIPNTEIGLDENASEEEKLQYLNAKRRERVKQFVEETEAQKPEKGSVADFESFDQAGEMSASISSLKSSLIVRFCVLLVTAVVSIYLTVATDTGLSLMPILANPSTYLLVNVVLALIASFASYTVIAVGIKKLFTLKADSDSLAAVSMLFSIIPAIAMLDSNALLQSKTVHIYISVAILGLLINTVGKLLIVTRTERNFRYISGGYSKYAAMHIDDEDVSSRFTKGALTDFPSLSTARKTEFVRDFIKNSYSADLTDTFSKFYVPISAGLSVVVGIICAFVFPERVATVLDRVFYALSCAAGTMSVMSAMSMMLVVNIPLAKASKKYLQSSAVMLGYSAVEKFADTNSVLIDAIDLFPDGMVDIINLKPVKKTPIEDGIIYAASLCCQTESILRPAFYKMIKGKTEMLYPVESYIYEDGLGLSGWIENKRVLFGNRALMESHSIEGLPTLEKEAGYAKGDNIVYLSIGGSLAMIYVIKIKASVSVARALSELEKQDITVIIRSVDSVLSITRLSEMFGVKPNIFKLLPFRYHQDYDAQTSYVASMSSPMIYSGRFSSLSMLLTGAKRLLKSSTVGVAVQALSALIGIILAVIFACVGAFGGMFTGTVVIAYNLVWVLITAVAQSIAKV